MANNVEDDPAEPDLYWAGPSGFAMLPIAVAVGLVSALSWFGVPRLANVLGLRHDWTTFILFQTILVVWLVFGIHSAYRAACVVARLTPQRIYLDYGFLYRPTPPVELHEIRSIVRKAGPLARLLRIGSVVIQTQGKRTITFVGLHRPESFVAAVQTAMQKANAK
jgi:membrane protein YdbS with pleckstrin-like domain